MGLGNTTLGVPVTAPSMIVVVVMMVVLVTDVVVVVGMTVVVGVTMLFVVGVTIVVGTKVEVGVTVEEAAILIVWVVVLVTVILYVFVTVGVGIFKQLQIVDIFVRASARSGVMMLSVLVEPLPVVVVGGVEVFFVDVAFVLGTGQVLIRGPV